MKYPPSFRVDGNGKGQTAKVREPMAESCKLKAFLKNEATDLLDNKGSALREIGNEATVLARRRVEGRMLNVEGPRPKGVFLGFSTLDLQRFDFLMADG